MKIDAKIVFEMLESAYRRGELDVVRLQVGKDVTYTYVVTRRLTQYAGIKDGMYWAEEEIR